MEQANEISRLYFTLKDSQQNCSPSQTLAKLQQQINTTPALPKAIAQYYFQYLNKNSQNVDELRQIIYLSQHLVSIPEHRALFEKISLEQINNLGKYIMNEDNEQGLGQAIKMIQILYLENSLVIYSTSQQLFRALLNKFIFIKEEQIHQLLTQVMVEMLLDNKKLINFANSPYYFLQFWLHAINQQHQMDRKLYWIGAIKKLYSVAQSEEFLFYESDFKTLIDLLLRAISNCTNGKQLRVPLECYLVLSCCKTMKSPYKLDHLKDQISCFNAKELQIEDLISEINSL